jgi:hypothetical protein
LVSDIKGETDTEGVWKQGAEEKKLGARGSAVVEVLCYKSEGRGFET